MFDLPHSGKLMQQLQIKINVDLELYNGHVIWELDVSNHEIGDLKLLTQTLFP